MVLDPIPQSLPVHFFGSRPQPPTSPQSSLLSMLKISTHIHSCYYLLIFTVARRASASGVDSFYTHHTPQTGVLQSHFGSGLFCGSLLTVYRSLFTNIVESFHTDQVCFWYTSLSAYEVLIYRSLFVDSCQTHYTPQIGVWGGFD